ncbi:MAG: DUF4118 domain-containing protein [Sulfuritalea sp.]|nr:DUF4118 domain-containing protein [Sulfuritalea sp.]
MPFLTFFPAAAISAVFGGFWAGMLATALGSVIATYFSFPHIRRTHSSSVMKRYSATSSIYSTRSWSVRQLRPCTAFTA